jgi:hypothetical protein
VAPHAAVEDLDRLISDSLKFQRKWQRLSMGAYVASTTGMLLCTTAGTYAAARDYAQLAALLAATAAVLIGLEKSLLFREKWKFHLAIATRLFILQTKLKLEGGDPAAIAMEYASILDNYANSIPISGREGQ